MPASPKELTEPARTRRGALPGLRVLFYVFFPGGGIGRYTKELASTLGTDFDLDVEVVCSPDFIWKEADGYRTWDGLRSLSHASTARRRLRFLAGQIINPRRFAAHASSVGADIVHFSNVNHLTFPFWRKALSSTGAAVVISVHDVQRQKSIVSRVWEDRQLKAVYQQADALFVHSDLQADELNDWADVRPDKIHVVPHGPYPHGRPTADRGKLRRRYGLPKNGQVALFFGQIRDEKNLEGFIRGMALCDENLHLFVAGAANSRHRDINYYEMIAREAGVGGRVTFLNRFIEEVEVADVFGTADWVALPYKAGFTSQSGVLNVAAHYRKPLLVGCAPVIRSTVESSQIGVAARGDEPTAIAPAIAEIMHQVPAGDAWRFDEYLDAHSWKENARRTVEVYRALMSERVTNEE